MTNELRVRSYRYPSAQSNGEDRGETLSLLLFIRFLSTTGKQKIELDFRLILWDLIFEDDELRVRSYRNPST